MQDNGFGHDLAVALGRTVHIMTGRRAVGVLTAMADLGLYLPEERNKIARKVS